MSGGARNGRVRQAVIALHRRHPLMSPTRIARLAGCDAQYARDILRLPRPTKTAAQLYEPGPRALARDATPVGHSPRDRFEMETTDKACDRLLAALRQAHPLSPLRAEGGLA